MLSLTIAKETGLDDILAMDYMGLGGNEIIAENYIQAQQYLEESVSIYRHMNNKSEIGLSLAGLAEAERRVEKLDEGRQHLCDALRIAIEGNAWETKIACIISYSLYLLGKQDLEKAIEYYALACQSPYISNSRYRED